MRQHRHKTLLCVLIALATTPAFGVGPLSQQASAEDTAAAFLGALESNDWESAARYVAPLRRILNSEALSVLQHGDRDFLVEASVALASIDPVRAENEDGLRRVVVGLHQSGWFYEALTIIEQFDSAHRPAYANEILQEVLSGDDESRRDHAKRILGSD